MTSARICVWVCLTAAVPAVAFGQGRQANPNPAPGSSNPAELTRQVNSSMSRR